MIYSRKFTLDQFTPVAVYHRLKEICPNETSFLFESVVNSATGNFSYIIIGEQEKVWHENNESFYYDGKETIKVDDNPLEFLQKHYRTIDQDIYKEYTKELKVGFVDGFIGYIGYDMVKEFEPVLKPKMMDLPDNLNNPDLYLVRPKLIAAYSHKNSELTLISSIEDLTNDFDSLEERICSNYDYLPYKPVTNAEEEGSFEFSKEQFFDMVDKSKEMIKSGDVFQILMSNRYTHKANVDRLSFYRTLRTKNPSPYLFLLEFDDFAIAGSSPEVMIQLHEGEMLLRPIAGTRKRGGTKARDKELEEEMINDEKECAEHLMLVDLGRNDVGRVAKKGTVKVPALMRVEKYSHVMHMVSDVIATLDDKFDMFDMFKATFTAGTMTGAPKIRAMELIAEFENRKRGYYSGAIGYFGFDGNMDSSITIRTALIKEDEIIMQAGAGIVADSQSELEYLEVKNKIAALVSSLKDLIDK